MRVSNPPWPLVDGEVMALKCGRLKVEVGHGSLLSCSAAMVISCPGTPNDGTVVDSSQVVGALYVTTLRA
eukprot:3281035-Amphidinium_carterae.1